MQIARIEMGTAPVYAQRCDTCCAPECLFRATKPEPRHLRRIHLDRGARLECDPGGCLKFWVVVSGTAATCAAFRDGRRQIASIEGPGDALCGPMAGHGTEHWLEALTELEICEIDLSSRAAELWHDAGFMAAMFRLSHARLEASLAHVSMLGRLDSMERVTLFLAEMAIREGGETAAISLPMSREDIADYLGLNTETVSRIFTRVRKSGLVRFLTPTEYLIPDMGALARRLPVEIPGYRAEALQ